eukprot:794496-Alexandrium_andersonii.AAC.1
MVAVVLSRLQVWQTEGRMCCSLELAHRQAACVVVSVAPLCVRALVRADLLHTSAVRLHSGLARASER